MKSLVPLKAVSVKAELRGPTAVTSVELTYFNPSAENPMECTYTFPLEKTTILSKFEAEIGGRVVKTKITEKEKAQEMFEDAVAGGHAAVHAERSKKDEVLTVKLGNLMPGQEAKLRSTIISQLEVVGGHFSFSLPRAFYPDYKKHGVKDANAFPYTFDYEVRIVSKYTITGLSIPDGAAISEQDEKKTNILVSCS